MATACRCPRGQQLILHMTISCPRSKISDPSRAPSPRMPPDKGKNESTKEKKEPVPSSPEEKTKGNYIPGGPGPPSSPSPPEPAPSTSSVATLLALMHPTLVLPKKSNTASVDFSFYNHLPEGALGCFHPWAFPMSFHSFLI